MVSAHTNKGKHVKPDLSNTEKPIKEEGIYYYPYEWKQFSKILKILCYLYNV